MRRQGQYADSAANTYVTAQVHMSGQQVEHKSSHFEERLEAFTPEREHQYGNSKPEGQWRWERDGPKMSNPMASHIFNEGQGGDALRSYFQGQRHDPKLALQNQSNNDSRSQTHEEDMDIGYEENILLQTFERLEEKFLNDIMKLAKDQNDAEDSENARHREKIGAINSQYEEQLAALRARHASRRDEFLRRESHARQHQYQQAVMDPYPDSGMRPSGYGGATAPEAVGEAQRGYSTENFDSYRERTRFLGGAKDRGFEPRGPYPGGRVYDTASRYY
ncbi:Ubiquitin carboxyl-terminal hydrolase [Quillaja saponaria]|uniref:Ubiquitin carboxyl-terminal hydrolase n=1 Tax=Quillaja saponaria TaxID=32244 RepID=A0AAD7QH49_QUISA|nr:Ubiquitin carboxyl-terminal hydrolase [Quillaja saponaria]